MKPLKTFACLALREQTLVLLLSSSIGAPALAQAAPAPPPGPPTNVRAIPNYSADSIALTWTHTGVNVTSFRVLRQEDGGAFVMVSPELGRHTRGFTDTMLTRTKEYNYSVHAVGPGGTGRSVPVRQNLKTIWPVEASHEILHNWNETIGQAGVLPDGMNTAVGFHSGVDIQREGPAGTENSVVAVRGGAVRNVAGGPDGVVNIDVIEGPAGASVLHVYQTNHIDDPLVAAGNVVYAGQPVAKISERHFVAAPFVQHTHYQFFEFLPGGAARTLGVHPLSIFTANGDRDPKEKEPRFFDHARPRNGTVLFQEQGAAMGRYLAGRELRGNVDIIVELRDELGTDPDQLPTKLAYWIQKPADTCGLGKDVRNGGSPYVLFSWANAYFGEGQMDLTRSMAIVDYGQNLGPTIFGEVPLPPAVHGPRRLDAYPWENYKHFIITNTKGTTGVPADVEAAQHWNTNAEDDGSDATVAHANFATKGDTNRARRARFPDGTYTVHVLASDLIHADVDLPFTVRLENFCPIVCSCYPSGSLPFGTTSSQGSVTFNEPMDTSMTPFPLVAIDNGASLSNAVWIDERTLVFQIDNLAFGENYVITVHANAARDLPAFGLVEGKMLDGNEDGTCGDDFTCGFSVEACGLLHFETEDDFATGLVNGQDISTPPEFGEFVEIDAAGPNAGAAIYDSTPGGPNDPSQDRDLLVGRGNILILQNSLATGQTTAGIFDSPNDDPDGGTFTFDFVDSVHPESLVLVDIDTFGQGAAVTLTDVAGRRRFYTVPAGWTEDLLTDGPPGWRQLDLTTLNPQPGFASIATAMQDESFDAASVVRITVALGGSGALDDLKFCP